MESFEHKLGKGIDDVCRSLLLSEELLSKSKHYHLALQVAEVRLKMEQDFQESLAKFRQSENNQGKLLFGQTLNV